MSNNFAKIPIEMRQYQQFICWQLVLRDDGSTTKVPHDPKTGNLASVTNPYHWGTFEQAVAASPNYSGIGFVFTAYDPYVGIDCDNKYLDDEIHLKHIEIYNAFNSYSERSPSKTGLHIICKGILPGPGRRRHHVEMYDRERYFTMTGDVYNDVAPGECQAQIDKLYAQMGEPAKTFVINGDQPETETDESIFNRANTARNAEKFEALFRGDWSGYYPSQSEADFALIDIIAFYTQARSQVHRIFLGSALGQREKAKRKAYVDYMIDKSFDRQLPPIDMQGFSIQLENAVLTKKKKKKPVPVEPISDIVFPEGLIGDIAQFLYSASPRPVKMIALAGAIGFMAGICGKAYNYSNTGLNQYVLMLAGTGTGKESIAGGISKLVFAIKSICPTILEFRGPSEIMSYQALQKHLSRNPCCFTISSEFGMRICNLSSKYANENITGLKRLIIDLHNKSGGTDVVEAMAYAKMENNVPPIQAPAFTIIAESTVFKFFQNIDEDVILDGLLPRFMIMEYDGKREYASETFEEVSASEPLVMSIAALVAQCQSLMRTNKVCYVKATPEVMLFLKKYDRWTTDQINDKEATEVSKNLWTRAHVKAFRLAALIAVGNDYINPIISLENAKYACDMITNQTVVLKARFDTGQVGERVSPTSSNEEAQLQAVVKFIGRMATEGNKQERADKFAIPLHMIEENVFTYSTMLRLSQYACFRNDKGGSGKAIKRAYDQLIDSDDLREISKNEMGERFGGKRAKAFCISNPDRFI